MRLESRNTSRDINFSISTNARLVFRRQNQEIARECTRLVCTMRKHKIGSYVVPPYNRITDREYRHLLWRRSNFRCDAIAAWISSPLHRGITLSRLSLSPSSFSPPRFVLRSADYREERKQPRSYMHLFIPDERLRSWFRNDAHKRINKFVAQLSSNVIVNTYRWLRSSPRQLIAAR